MRYIAHVVQEGEGCDYMISCGETVWELEAENENEALIELKERIIGVWDADFYMYHGGYWDEDELESVTLFEVSKEISLPIKQLYNEATQYEKNQIAAKTQDKERKEYERLKARLKAKFEGKKK